MSGYVRKRLIMDSAYSPFLRNAQQEHIWGGDNVLSDATKQGSSFAGSCLLTLGQFVGRVSTAGSGTPPADLCYVINEKDDESHPIYQTGFLLDTTGWKRLTDAIPSAAGNEQFDGENYASTPNEMLARRDHVGTGVCAHTTFTYHGWYYGP